MVDVQIRLPIIQQIQFLLLQMEETNNEPPPNKRKLSDIDDEQIIMGTELCDADINRYSFLNWVALRSIGSLVVFLPAENKLEEHTTFENSYAETL